MARFSPSPANILGSSTLQSTAKSKQLGKGSNLCGGRYQAVADQNVGLLFDRERRLFKASAHLLNDVAKKAPSDLPAQGYDTGLDPGYSRTYQRAPHLVPVAATGAKHPTSKLLALPEYESGCQAGLTIR
jgi:hypothetical protein